MKLKVLFLPLSIIVSLVIVIWMVKPQWDTYNSQKINLEAVKASQQVMESNVSGIEKSLSDFSEQTDKITLIGNAIPSSYDDDNFVAEMNQKAADAGVIIDSTSITEKKEANAAPAASPDVEVSGVTPVAGDSLTAAAPINLSQTIVRGVKLEVVSGSYVSIKKFIEAMEKMNRFVDFEDYKISKSEGEGEGAASEIKASLSFNVYSMPENEKVQISKLISSKEPNVMSLVTPGLNVEAAEIFSTEFTASPFRGVESSGGGREDIFNR